MLWGRRDSGPSWSERPPVKAVGTRVSSSEEDPLAEGESTSASYSWWLEHKFFLLLATTLLTVLVGPWLSERIGRSHAAELSGCWLSKWLSFSHITGAHSTLWLVAISVARHLSAGNRYTRRVSFHLSKSSISRERRRRCTSDARGRH
jgi:hypothetical protein